MWLIYSIGDPGFLAEILTAVSLATGGGDFRDILQIGMLLGVLVVAVQAVRLGGFRIDGGAVALSLLLYSAAIAPRVDVAVEGVYDGTVRTVGNVPLGVAAVGSLTSRVGYGLTVVMETAFSAPAMTTHGYGNAIEVLKRVRLHGLASPASLGASNSPLAGTEFYGSWRQFMKDCTIPGLAGGHLREDDIRRAPSFMAALLWTGRVRMTKLNIGADPPDGEECPDAHARLANFTVSTMLPVYYNVVHRVLGLPNGAAVPGAVADALARLGASGVSEIDFLTTALLAPIWDEALAQYFHETQRATYAKVVQDAARERALRFSAQESLFNSYARPLVTFLEGFGYAVFPLLALMLVLGAVGIGLAGRYFQLMLWLQLWTPLLAVVNLFLHNVVTGGFADIAGGGSPLSSLAGVLQGDEVVARWLGVAGLMASSVPVLAFFLVQQGMSGIASLAGQVSSGAGVNTGWAAVPTYGQAPAAVGALPMSTVEATAGQRTTGAPRLDPSFSFARENGASVESARQSVEARSRAFRAALTESRGSLLQFGSGTSESEGASGSERVTRGEAHRVAENRLGSVAESIAQRFGVTQTQALEFAARVAAGGATPESGAAAAARIGPVGGSAGASSGVALSQAQVAEATRLVSQAMSQDRSLQSDLTTAAANDWSRSNSQSALRQGSVSNGEELSRSADEYLNASRSYHEAQRQSESSAIRQTIGAGDAVALVLRSPEAQRQLQGAVTALGAAEVAQRFAAAHQDRAGDFGGPRGMAVFSQLMAVAGQIGGEPRDVRQQQFADRLLSGVLGTAVGPTWRSPVGAGGAEGRPAEAWTAIGPAASVLPGGQAGFEGRRAETAAGAEGALNRPLGPHDAHAAAGAGRRANAATAEGWAGEPGGAAQRFREREAAAAAARLSPGWQEQVRTEAVGVPAAWVSAALNLVQGNSLAPLRAQNAAWARSQGLTEAQAELYGHRAAMPTFGVYEQALRAVAAASPGFAHNVYGPENALEQSVRAEAARSGANPDQVVGLIQRASRETRGHAADEMALLRGMNEARDPSSGAVPDALSGTLRRGGSSIPGGSAAGAVGPPPATPPAGAVRALTHALDQLGRTEDGIGPYLTSAASWTAANDPNRDAWCAGFVNASLARGGVAGSGSNIANSFRAWGVGVADPRSAAAGDVLVQHNGRGAGLGGHVGFATGETRTHNGRLQLQMLSGNDNDRVALSWRDAEGLDIRRATPALAQR